MAARFEGFPPEALEFFRALARHNRRDWFQARKHIFEQKVRAPMIELVEAINQELLTFAPEHVTDPREAIYRIYRDTRFSADKTPYKTHIAANFPRRGFPKHTAAGYYFGISPKEVEIAAGIYMPGPEQLRLIRAYLAEHHAEIRRIISEPALSSLMGKLEGERLARSPKGFPKGHPAEDLLGFKQWYFYVTLEPGLATTPALLPEIIRRFRLMQPFVEAMNRPLLEQRRAAAGPALTFPTRVVRRRAL